MSNDPTYPPPPGPGTPQGGQPAPVQPSDPAQHSGHTPPEGAHTAPPPDVAPPQPYGAHPGAQQQHGYVAPAQHGYGAPPQQPYGAPQQPYGAAPYGAPPGGYPGQPYPAGGPGWGQPPVKRRGWIKWVVLLVVLVVGGAVFGILHSDGQLNGLYRSVGLMDPAETEGYDPTGNYSLYTDYGYDKAKRNLVGKRWARDCSGTSGSTFNADGTFTANGMTGTWELDRRSVLTMTGSDGNRLQTHASGISATSMTFYPTQEDRRRGVKGPDYVHLRAC